MIEIDGITYVRLVMGRTGLIAVPFFLALFACIAVYVVWALGQI